MATTAERNTGRVSRPANSPTTEKSGPVSKRGSDYFRRLRVVTDLALAYAERALTLDGWEVESIPGLPTFFRVKKGAESYAVSVSHGRPSDGPRFFTRSLGDQLRKLKLDLRLILFEADTEKLEVRTMHYPMPPFGITGGRR